MSEVWKDIVNYEGFYQVSNLGRVRSLDRYDNRGIFHKSQIIKPKEHPRGYYGISLWKEGKQSQFLVHRLVAQAFIPNENDMPDINHRNENKTDNRADNLEWCDKEYNNNYGQHHEKHNSAIGWYMRSVIQLSSDGETIATYPSVSEAARSIGVSAKAIRLCISGKNKKCGGYRWKYLQTQ